MKVNHLYLAIVFLFFVTISVIAESSDFTPLTFKEKLSYTIIDDPKDVDKYELIVYSEGDQKKEVFRKSAYNFLFKKDCQDLNSRWFLFSTLVQKGLREKKQIVELWYIDGINGGIQKLYSSKNISYCIDDKAVYICIYDYLKSNNTPTIDVYSFPDMKEIKSITVDEFTNKGVAPDSIHFGNHSFFVELSNDGPDNKTIEIPLK